MGLKNPYPFLKNASLDQSVVCPFCGAEQDRLLLLKEHADSAHAGWLQRPIAPLGLQLISLKPRSTYEVLKAAAGVLL